MFKARLDDASVLKKVIDAIKDLINDVNFICTDEGIQMQAMDTSHVALICLTLLADGFSVYECSEHFTLGLNVSILAKILKCAESGDSVILEAEPSGDTLSITLESANGGRQSVFEITRLSIESDGIEIPDVEYSCSVTMPCGVFTRVVRDIATFDETCVVSIKEGVVSFGVKNNMSQITIDLKEDKTSKKKEEHLSINVSDAVKQLFAVRYLSQFAKTSGISDQVGIFMSEGTPLYVTYDMGSIGSVGYYLAPKIEDD